MRKLIRVFVVMAGLSMATVAWAEGAAEIKAATKIEKHEAVDPKTEFTAGETVYVWTKLTGLKDKTVSHVWKKDGKEVWRMDHAVAKSSYRTYSKRRSIKAGAWSVEVVAEGASLGSIDFTVK